MNITTDKPYMVFKKDGQYGAMYSIGLSKKNKNGGYDNGYISVKFKNDVDIQDRTNIYIKSAWLTFNVKDKKTYPYIFINSFETVEQTIEKTKEESKQIDPLDKAVEEFNEEVSGMELPF